MQPPEPAKAQQRAAWPHLLAVLVLMCLLSVVMTWPLAQALQSSGQNDGGFAVVH